GAGVGVADALVALLGRALTREQQPVAAGRRRAQGRALVVVVEVAVVALLALLDPAVAAALDLTRRAAAVAILEVAVVAGLVGALVVVAADVEDAAFQAPAARAVVGPVVALLHAVPGQPVTADRVRAHRGALAGVGVERALIAHLALVEELVAA